MVVLPLCQTFEALELLAPKLRRLGEEGNEKVAYTRIKSIKSNQMNAEPSLSKLQMNAERSDGWMLLDVLALKRFLAPRVELNRV